MQIFDYWLKDKNNDEVKKEQEKILKEQEKQNKLLEKQKKEQEEVTRVRNIIEKNMLDFHNLEYREYIDDYKRYLWDVSERLQYIDDSQANASHPLVFMMVDTIFWTVFDFDYQLDLKTKWIEKACVEAYDFMNKSKHAMWEAIKEALIIWKSVIRDYTYFEEWKYEMFGEKIKYDIKSPTMEYISAFNVMYDRMSWLNNSTYKIIRHFLTKDEILNKMKWILSPSVFKENENKLKEQIKKLKNDDSNRAFSYFNYEAIKWILFTDIFQKRIINQMNNDRMKNEKDKVKYELNVDTADSIKDLNKNTCNNMKFARCYENSLFLNDFNTKYEIIEFIEWNMKYFFINWEFIFKTEINPYIYNLTAFHYNEVPWSWKSIWLSFILKPLADASNAMLNMFFDSVKLWNTIIFKQEWIWKKESKIPLKNWTVVNWDIARINLWWNDFSWFNWLQALQNIAQSTVWISDMIMWWDSRVQRIAWAFDFAFSQYKSRLTPFTDSIDMAMSKIVKGRICQYLTYYTQDELEELFDIQIEKKKKDWQIDFIIDWVSVKDILNENNISFKFDSMFNLKKDNLKKTAMDVFQLAQQYNNEKVDWIKLLKLLAWDDSIKLEEILWIQDEWVEWLLEWTWVEEDNILWWLNLEWLANLNTEQPMLETPLEETTEDNIIDLEVDDLWLIEEQQELNLL